VEGGRWVACHYAHEPLPTPGHGSTRAPAPED
jgi:hypothetical protein